jgi:hypothetical protein
MKASILAYDPFFFGMSWSQRYAIVVPWLNIGVFFGLQKWNSRITCRLAKLSSRDPNQGKHGLWESMADRKGVMIAKKGLRYQWTGWWFQTCLHAFILGCNLCEGLRTKKFSAFGYGSVWGHTWVPPKIYGSSTPSKWPLHPRCAYRHQISTFTYLYK